MEDVVERFLRDEADAYVRSRILEEAASRSAGEAYLTFNVFNVRLHFDTLTATVEDELCSDREESLPLDQFLSLVRF